MTTRATWLPEVLARAGCTVVTMSGWETRGRTVAGFYGVIWHATATGPRASDQNVANLLRDGRSDLPGPLCQLGLDRHGRYWLVASGKGNHNGMGTYGNNAIGIEAFNDNLGEPWPTVQVDAYVRGTAAILDHLNLPTNRVLAHRESDPTRKTDPRGIDMDRARRRIDAHRQQEDWLMALTDAEQAELLEKVRGIHSSAPLYHTSLAEKVDKLAASSLQYRDSLASLVRRLFGVDPVAKNDDQPFWRTGG